MYYVYVLYSEKFKRFYKGYSKDLENKLKQHNSGMVISSKPYLPWRIIYYEKHESKEEALKREKYFKTAAGRRFLKTKLKELT